MDAAMPPPTGQPSTLDAVAAALAPASPVDMYRHAGLFDDAGRGLRDIADALDQALTELDEVWRGVGTVAPRGREPLARTRQLLHDVEGAGYGQRLRMAADSLAAGQVRVRDLTAQRAVAPDQTSGYDEQARLVLDGLSGVYQEIGVSLGAPPLPRPPVDGAPLVLAAAGPESDAADLFRPVAASQSGDPVVPPAGGTAGGGAAGGGAPMMPFMPMGGIGMGGMGGMQQEGAAQQRRGAAYLQSDKDAWGDPDDGWNVLGRRERIKQIHEQLRNGTKGDKDG